MTLTRAVAFSILAVNLAFAAHMGPHAKAGPRIRLFNGRNLDGFYTFLRDHGKNNDPDHVFRVENGMVHVSGAEFGYFITEKEYQNYYLHVEFKWGEGTHGTREGKARDSGVLFHVNGEDKVWPKSIEFQMIEGGTGDIILVDGVSLTVKGETKSKGRFDRFGKGPWKDVVGYRDPEHEVERAHGGWNCLELWALGDTVRYVVNGVLVNEGSAASVRKGKILFQSEGAEVWFRKIELRQLEPDASQPLSAGMHRDIEFAKAGDVSLTLDAYVPDGPGPFPAVVVVHGGGWRNGDKQTYVKPLFDPLTRGGFAWFTINYRLAPAYHFPAPADDVESAVRYVEAHAREYKVDRKRIALMGESAGGHLVSFVGARDGRKLHLAAVVPFYAPNDLDSLVEGPDKTGGAGTALGALLGFTDVNDDAIRRLREASPVTYVKKGMPPYLIIHGTKDPLVPFHQAVEMCDKMKQAGSSCEIFPVEGAGHGVGGWEKNPAFQQYKVKMVEWLKQHLR